QAAAVAGAARRAAAESRDLLTDLRAHTALAAPPLDLPAELSSRVADFESRTGLTATFTHKTTPTLPPPLAPLPPLPPGTSRHLLAIASEALENAHRHANATRVDVTLTSDTRAMPPALRLTVRDDGTGPAVSLEDVHVLARSGHFGLLGMLERAASVGAGLRLCTAEGGGTEVTVDLPLPSPLSARPPHTPQEEAAHA
ncbi:sensor histidine kinase, partial [Streptomyces sp. 8P21H-1]|uniref:sensor histidine kinase n=1 Tax=Streptomyces sp. 8P21H-1 TaxID=2737048 RepID=UPI0034A003AE|nr:two-component sensor histidine kinase [Streptomyces sp. 8P21H-1]